METLAQESCIPRSEDSPPMQANEIDQLHLDTPMWQVVEEGGIKRLRREFEFDEYVDGARFALRVAGQAHQQGHHPNINIAYKRVVVEWYTHDIGGLHRNDFIMASKSDAIFLRLLDENRSKNVVQESSEGSFPASDPPGWIGSTGEEGS